MIYLAGIVITFFLAILLTGKKNKTTADSILITWLCVMGLHLIFYYLYISGKSYDYPSLLGIPVPYPLLHGPLLFLYTSALTNQLPQKKAFVLLHFLPIAIIYLFMIPFFNLSPEEKINVYRHNGAGYEVIIQVCFWAIILSGIVYVTASLFLLRRYRLSIENEFSNIEKINLAWLRYLIYGIGVIWIAVIIGNDTLIFSSVVLFVFLLGFFGIRQEGIFTRINTQGNDSTDLSTPKISAAPTYKDQIKEKENETGTSDPGSKIKYEKSGLDNEKAGIIYNRLVSHMTGQKLFTDSELTLAALAKTLDVHPNHLSQVINSFEGKNFYDYINSYRVEEFKRLAPSPDNRNYTLLSLAYECGFNSKTSFNRNFRKATGLSPTEWLQQLHISLK